MSLDQFLNRKYKFEKSENFDEYMKAMGVGIVLRKIGNALSPVVTIRKEDDEYILTSNSTFKNIVHKFKPGVEFDHDTPDGRRVKATLTIDGNTVHEIQKSADGKTTTIERIFTDDYVKTIMKVDNITATRFYKAQVQ